MRSTVLASMMAFGAALALLGACNDAEPASSLSNVAAAAEESPPPPAADDAAADVLPEPPPVAEASGSPDPNWPIKPYKDPHAVLTMADGAVVLIELEKEMAPSTVENFIRLAEQKFYDDTVFHRVVPGFMAQGGSPDGKGMDGPGWTIDLEIHPGLRHVRGAVAMARKPDPNSAGSQFYICYEAKGFLDDQYAVFGKVVDGMDVVDGFKYGSTNPREMAKQGWDAPEDGYPTRIATLRVTDGAPSG